MNFSSDTAAPAHPDVLAAMAEANAGPAPSYGNDALTEALRARLREIFETGDLAATVVTSGTGSNALALSLLTPGHGAVLCHEAAHIHEHERGAPEFFTGGAKLQLLEGDHGRIAMPALEAALDHRNPDLSMSARLSPFPFPTSPSSARPIARRPSPPAPTPRKPTAFRFIWTARASPMRWPSPARLRRR